ncbi:MAG: TIGR03643 family protein [Chitinophagaceae bacterium]|jgi:uncharacterized protein (TIGR03643 family)
MAFLMPTNLYKACYTGMLTQEQIDRIIEMAWEDRTPFEAIEFQFGLNESAVIALMRTHMKASSFKMWRKRTNGRSTKHFKLRSTEVDRFKCTRQRTISLNKISKR